MEKNAAIQEQEKWEKALVSLTPGGSEFAGDPENCVRHIRERFENNHKLTAEAIKERKRLEAINKELLEALDSAPFTSKYNSAETFIEAYEKWRDDIKIPAVQKAKQ